MQTAKTDSWKMFNAISQTYDRLNRILSLGIDKRWRKKVAGFLPAKDHLALLDCATGTGDQIIALMRRPEKISHAVGLDLAGEMLDIARKKVRRRPYAQKVEFRQASMSSIPYPDETFDCVTVSFGIRNAPDTHAALKEMLRVLKPGGRLIVLEFSMPQNRPLKAIHLAYLRHFIPTVGGLLSKDRKAYSYLNRTIEAFPFGKEFLAILEGAGFSSVRAHPLTFGIATIYQGDKRG